MKRRIAAVLIACAMVLSACSSDQQTQKNPETENTTQVSESSESSSQESTSGTEETAGEEFPEDPDYGYVTTGGSPWLNTNLRENLDENMEVSLKDDFYLYVNHDWLCKAQIPDGYMSWNNFDEVSDQTMSKAVALLEDTSLEGHDAELIQSLYHAVLDWDARNAAGVQPIMGTIEDIQGITTIDELSDFICDMDRAYAVPTFVNAGNGTDLVDSGKYVLYVTNDSLMLSDAAEYQERTEQGERFYAGYQYLAEEMLPRVGFSKEEAAKMLENALSVETKLAENAYTSADRMSQDYYSMIYNLYTKEEMKEVSGKFPLMRFIDAIGYGNAKEYLVLQPQVFKSLDELYCEENLEAIKDYMILKFTIGSMGMLDREAYELSSAADNMMLGSEGMISDEERAFTTVQNSLTVPMNRAYLEKYDASEIRERIRSLIDRIVKEYREMLREEDWLSEETKALAIEKLDSMRINAIYPDEWDDYSELDLTGASYWECMHRISDFYEKEDLKNTNGRVDKDKWEVDTLTANAYYQATNNSVTILLGLMGADFYYDGISDEELYAGIGCIIGHEISHAFDTNGSQFDKDGNMVDWWSDEDYEAFQSRANKMIDYFDQMTAWEGAPIVGSNIQTEETADLAGMKVILRLAEKDENFDYEKFFRHYAKIWKEICTYEFEYYAYAMDVHALNYMRVNANLQQFEKFFETFGISEGDGMYLAPEKNVQVW